MANYSELLTRIAAAIYSNTTQDIDAVDLRGVLNDMVGTMGAGYTFQGLATTDGTPGYPDQKVFFVTATAGTYTNYGALEVATGELAFLCFDGAWMKVAVTALTSASIADDLTTGDASKILSARQGTVLKAADDAMAADIGNLANLTTSNQGNLVNAINELDAEKANDSDLATLDANTQTKLDQQDADIETFKAAIQAQINNYPMITINGNVTNAPDEEDLTTDANDLLKFKNRSGVDGMGYIILRKNATFASQLTQTDTIYEIRYDFDLGGASVTIPSGCVLKFEGGSLSNGTLIGQSTQISGVAKILSDISGTFLGNIDVSWFGLTTDDTTFDNGAIINKVGAVCTNLFIPAGLYYLQTPIVLGNNVKTVDINGELRFNGTLTNATAFTIGSANSNIYIHSLYCDENSVNYSDANNTNVTGFCITNCKVSSVSIDAINGFNTGVKLFGNGAGCCEIHLDVKYIIRFNYGIVLTQDNGGWCNENYINGCKFDSFSIERDMFETMCAIYMAGPKAKNPENTTDTYDKINNIHIVNCCAETFGTKPVIVARNATNLNVGKFRYESSDIILKGYGYIENISFDKTSYDYSINKIDLSNVSRFLPIKESFENYMPIKNIAVNEVCDNDIFVCHITTGLVSTKKTSGNEIVGYVFNVSKGNSFLLRSQTAQKHYFRVLRALNENNVEVDVDSSNYEQYIVSGNSVYTPTGSIVFRTGSNVNISEFLINDSRIKKVFFGIQSGEGLISTNCINVEQNRIAKGGTFENKPTLLSQNKGFQYWDESNQMPVIFNGTIWYYPNPYDILKVKGDWEQNQSLDNDLFVISPSYTGYSKTKTAGTHYIFGYVFEVVADMLINLKANSPTRFAYMVITGKSGSSDVPITSSNADSYKLVSVLGISNYSKTSNGVSFRNGSNITGDVLYIDSTKIKKVFVGIQQDGVYTGGKLFVSGSWTLESNIISKSGTTRPTLLANDKGFQFFDENLLKPIWWNGTNWVDATDNAV